MTLRLYKRGCRLTLITPSALPNAFFDRQPGPENAIEITDMRVEFAIEKTVKSHPNRAEIVITNLAERTRVICEKKPLSVWLDAGYDGELHQLFLGDVRHAYSKLEKPEWKTVLQLGDGDRACRLARVNKTYSGGTSVLTAVRDCAGAMGLQLNPVEIGRLTVLNTQFVNPRSIQGSAKDELSRLVAPYGVGWSIQNGRLQLLRDEDCAEGQAFLIGQETGLVETPEYTTPTKEGKPPALKFKTLLYPALSPGKLVEVHSKAVSGRYFRIQRVTHRGDTHGPDWFSEVEAIPADLGQNSTGSTKAAEGGETEAGGEGLAAPGNAWLRYIKQIGTKK